MDFLNYRHIKYQTRKRCVICETEIDKDIIPLAEFPVTEVYVSEKPKEKMGYVEQGFCFCKNCGHGQILNVLDPQLQYGNSETYFFRSSRSMSGRATAEYFASFVNGFLGEKIYKNIVEIGCNDLYLLKMFRDRANMLIGIDPILKGHEGELSGDDILGIGDFFENVDLKMNIDVVFCKDTLEHVPEPKEFIRKIVDRCSGETLFFFQFPILEELIKEMHFEQIFHQHLNYFSIKSILRMLDDLGCNLLDYRLNQDHWGSILIFFKKGKSGDKLKAKLWNMTAEEILDRYRSFKLEMEQIRRRLLDFENESIYGYGAALMLPVLSYHLKSDLSCLQGIIDEDESKDGKYYINLPIPIIHRSKIQNAKDFVILITAVFSKMVGRQIVQKVLMMNPKNIIIPFPLI